MCVWGGGGLGLKGMHNAGAVFSKELKEYSTCHSSFLLGIPSKEAIKGVDSMLVL